MKDIILFLFPAIVVAQDISERQRFLVAIDITERRIFKVQLYLDFETRLSALEYQPNVIIEVAKNK
ncbi:MAG: hypothetical protein ACI9SJ_001333 [Flavobacteriaceae bacterium]